MKKIVSLVALCAVLFGAVLMATGCGSKPAKGSVWKVTKYEAKAGSVTTNTLDGYSKMYYCFHADGHVYKLSQLKLTGAKEQGAMDGGYLVKDKKLIWSGRESTISDKDKDTLTFTYTEKVSGIDTTYTIVMKASKDYTADQMKAKSQL